MDIDIRRRHRYARVVLTCGFYTPTFADRHGKRRKTVGWEFVHIAIDDCTRLAYAEVLRDEKATTAIAFLRRAWRSSSATASKSSGC